MTKQRKETENHLEIDVVELNTDTPLLVKGKLGNKEVVFAIDSGVMVDCISGDFYQKHFSHLTLEKARHLSQFLFAGDDMFGESSLASCFGICEEEHLFLCLEQFDFGCDFGPRLPS